MKVNEWTDDGQFPFTDKDAEKAREKLTSILAKADAQNKATIASQQRQAFQQQSYKALISTEEGRDLVKAMTGSTYLSEYCCDGISFSADGRLTYNYETWTVDQWEQIVELVRQQRVALAALKESFKAAQPFLMQPK